MKVAKITKRIFSASKSLNRKSARRFSVLQMRNSIRNHLPTKEPNFRLFKVILASDHAGFRLKAGLKRFLENKGYICEESGPYIYKHGDDYPDYIIPAAEKVAKADSSAVRGVVIGWSGQGEAIAANKVRGVRAAVYCGQKIENIILTRKHNDANVLSIGAHFVSAAAAKKAVLLWLETAKSSHSRHARRLRKIAHYEKTRRA